MQEALGGSRGAFRMRRYFYDRFVKHWPDLEEWFEAPLLARLDLSQDGAQSLSPGGKRTGPAYDAGSYLTYLALVHRMPMDADWVLSRNFDSVKASAQGKH
ncbi:hypothetical protein AB0I81_57505 [Nonomuraea sp. NPDC050404]|uniref:hypothetical protein n=1 Tax=Nonomuraea sp. NPDC050404 TaxID=3155783 RepID=UPI0033C7AFA9